MASQSGTLVEYRGKRGTRFYLRYFDATGKRVSDKTPAGTSRREAHGEDELVIRRPRAVLQARTRSSREPKRFFGTRNGCRCAARRAQSNVPRGRWRCTEAVDSELRHLCPIQRNESRAGIHRSWPLGDFAQPG